MWWMVVLGYDCEWCLCLLMVDLFDGWCGWWCLMMMMWIRPRLCQCGLAYVHVHKIGIHINTIGAHHYPTRGDESVMLMIMITTCVDDDEGALWWWLIMDDEVDGVWWWALTMVEDDYHRCWWMVRELGWWFAFAQTSLSPASVIAFISVSGLVASLFVFACVTEFVFAFDGATSAPVSANCHCVAIPITVSIRNQYRRLQLNT